MNLIIKFNVFLYYEQVSHVRYFCEKKVITIPSKLCAWSVLTGYFITEIVIL